MKKADPSAYIRLFEELSTERIDQAHLVAHSDILFKDPFNDITGIDLFKKLLHKTLSDVSNPKFAVTHQAWDGDVLFLRWTFSGTVTRVGHWDVTGMSELHFDDAGLVLEHIDHWDASEQFYKKLPIIGGLIRFIQRKLRVS